MILKESFGLIGIISLLAVLGLGLSVGCSDDDDDSAADTDTDTDTDTDSDTDTDTDTDTDLVVDCSECTAPVCIGSVSGHVELDNGSPSTEAVTWCLGTCNKAELDENGDFSFIMPGGCYGADWDAGDDPIHITLNSELGTYTRYSFAVNPEAQGDLDSEFNFDTGTHYQYELPSEEATYTSAGGATVDNLDGVSFTVPAGALGEDDLSIKAFEYPIDTTIPPFASEVTLDALYFLAPYFEELSTSVQLSIDPTAAGWAEGDTGTVYMLGDYVGHYLDCGGGDVEVGDFVDCKSAEVSGGVIVTEAIPLLGWVGLVKD